MTARNAPCPCGSGKKYKRCHGRADSAVTPAAAPRAPLESLMQQARQAWKLDDLVAAEAALSDAVTLYPNAAGPRQRLFEVQIRRGRLQAAEQSANRLLGLALPPGVAQYYLGVVAQLQGRLTQAIDAYAQAVSSQRQAAGQSALGEAELKVACCLQLCDTAAGNYPGSLHRADEGMFEQQEERQLLQQALESWEQELPHGLERVSTDIRSKHADGWYNLGCAAMAGFSSGSTATVCFERALRLDPQHWLARMNRVFSQNYRADIGPEELFVSHRELGEWLESRSASAAPAREFGQRRRLRIAYLSPDFRQHSVAHFIIPVLQHHDRDQFEIILVSNVQREDEITERCRQLAERFIDVSGLEDRQAREQIEAAGIDILIDLAGLTLDNRYALLQPRLAPLQANWIGYPNTTGLHSVDLRIVDELTDPAPQADTLATEKLLRLGRCFSAFAPLHDYPAVEPPPHLRRGHITFGSFNSLPKLNPSLLACWSRLLHELPDSRLVIKNPAMSYANAQAPLIQEFRRHGIDDSRISFLGVSSNQFEHLQAYREVDIALDSFPYNGTTTTCDSLCMGVPVVALRGQDHRSRVAFSQLSAVGLESLVANDQNSYVSVASELAGRSDYLGRLRTSLRDRLLQSPLCDSAGLTRSLEKMLLDEWRQRCSEDSP